MDLFNTALNAALRALTALFSWAPPWAGLTVYSILAGLAMLWVFRRTSDQAGLRAVKRKVHAYLLEMRVYADEPAATWRAQKSLLAANLRYMTLALRPALWMVLPLALLLIHLEAFYGRAPLEVGQPALITAGVRDAGRAPKLRPPAGIEITAPPVRLQDDRQVCWRINPRRPLSSELLFDLDGESVSTSIEAGGSVRFVAGRRVSSALAALWNPDEPRLPPGEVQWIQIAYPEARLLVFGWRIHWLVWFFVVSMLSALIFRKRFGVTL